jgi:hypothetical protein
LAKWGKQVKVLGYIWRYDSIMKPLGLRCSYKGGTMTIWQTVERPGYFGRHRDEKYRGYDQQYGASNWRIAWQIGERVGGLEEAVMLYEDAYFAFMKGNSAMIDQLVAEALDVYDDSPSNVQSRLNYLAQETNRTHLQDVAIRRCLVRLGRCFQGQKLIQIRDALGDHPLSLVLSPGQVPFHRPELILQPELEGWWLPSSVEAFYQSNKLLQVSA